MSKPSGSSGELTSAEKDRYDRQIRLWGAAAQSRLQNSKILVCGLYGCQIESLKNLVLTGVNADIFDDKVVCADDLSFNFFLVAEDVGKKLVDCALPKIQDLNNLASINELKLPGSSSNTGGLLDLTADAVAQYSVVLLADCYSKEELLHATRLCDETRVPYFVSGGALLDAWYISCLGTNYEFRNDPPNNKELRTLKFPKFEEIVGGVNGGTPAAEIPCSALVTKLHPTISPVFLKARVLLDYCSGTFSSRLGLSKDVVQAELQEYCEKFAATEGFQSAAFTVSMVEEMCSVAVLRNRELGGGRFLSNPVVVHSIIGSFLSQEVIKVISLVGEPMFNIFVFSGATFEGKAFPARKPVVAGEEVVPAAKRQKVEVVEVFEL